MASSEYTSLGEIYRDHTGLAKSLVVKNVPKLVTDEQLQNFLEVVCNENVDCLIRNCECHLAIAVFEEVVTDSKRCLQTMSTKTLEGRTIKLEHIGSLEGIFLSDIPEACTHDCLQYYFENKKRFGGSDGCIHDFSITVIGGKRYAVVMINDGTVIDVILSKPEHKPNGEHVVNIEPYFASFHDYLIEKLHENEKENVSGQTRKGHETRAVKPKHYDTRRQGEETNRGRNTFEEDIDDVYGSDAYSEIKTTFASAKSFTYDVTSPTIEVPQYRKKRPQRKKTGKPRKDNMSGTGAHPAPPNVNEDGSLPVDGDMDGSSGWPWTKEEYLPVTKIVMLRIGRLPQECQSLGLDVRIIWLDKHGKIVIKSKSEDHLKAARLKMFEILSKIKVQSEKISKQRSEFLALRESNNFLTFISKKFKLGTTFESNTKTCCLDCYAFSSQAAYRGIQFAIDKIYVVSVQLQDGQESALTCSDWSSDKLTVFVQDSKLTLEGFIKDRDVIDATKEKMLKHLNMTMPIYDLKAKYSQNCFESEHGQQIKPVVTTSFHEEHYGILRSQVSPTHTRQMTPTMETTFPPQPIPRAAQLDRDMYDSQMHAFSPRAAQLDRDIYDPPRKAMQMLANPHQPISRFVEAGGDLFGYSKDKTQSAPRAAQLDRDMYDPPRKAIQQQAMFQPAKPRSEDAVFDLIGYPKDTTPSILQSTPQTAQLEKDLYYEKLKQRQARLQLANLRSADVDDTPSISQSSRRTAQPYTNLNDPRQNTTQAKEGVPPRAKPRSVDAGGDFTGYSKETTPNVLRPMTPPKMPPTQFLASEQFLGGRDKHTDPSRNTTPIEKSGELTDMTQMHHRAYVERRRSVIVKNTKVVIKTGAITEQTASYISALVNIVAPSKNIHEDSVVSKAFVKAGGQELINSYESSMSSNMVTVTQAFGQLKCDVVFHVALTKGSRHCRKAIKEAMNEIFGECRTWGCEFVAFPPLGVGRLYEYPADAVATHMLRNTVEFLKNETHTLKEIVFVIFDDVTYDDFDKELRAYKVNPARYDDIRSEFDVDSTTEHRRQERRSTRDTYDDGNNTVNSDSQSAYSSRRRSQSCDVRKKDESPYAMKPNNFYNNYEEF